MPLFYQQHINEGTRLALWEIREDESFFLQKVPGARLAAHPHKRLQHLAGRFLLQLLYPDFPYDELRIADSRKPFLPDESCHFSISHSGDYAAAIVSTTNRVGVDVEVCSPKVARVSHKFLHPDEQALFANEVHAADRQLELLTLLWCAKEAVFKWWSYGEVDFSEQIRMHPFVFEDSGTMKAEFLKEEPVSLTLDYRTFGSFALAWTRG